MWNWWPFGKEPEPPPLVVLVPPLFDFPPLAARNRMLESSYDVVFGKLALRCLFNDYFQQPQHFVTRILLKPIDDPHVDLIATVISFIYSLLILSVIEKLARYGIIKSTQKLISKFINK